MVYNLKILSEIAYKIKKNLDLAYTWKWLSLNGKMEETEERIICRNLLGMI